MIYSKIFRNTLYADQRTKWESNRDCLGSVAKGDEVDQNKSSQTLNHKYIFAMRTVTYGQAGTKFMVVNDGDRITVTNDIKHC